MLSLLKAKLSSFPFAGVQPYERALGNQGALFGFWGSPRVLHRLWGRGTLRSRVEGVPRASRSALQRTCGRRSRCELLLLTWLGNRLAAAGEGLGVAKLTKHLNRL
jgi:hypothetical protein